MKSYVISLDRRKDRLDKFYNNLPKDWPIEKPVHYSAIAGNLCYPPSWWKQGGGAWGCYKSHLNIIEQELNNNSKEDILILEDDAIFCEDFSAKFNNLLKLVPNDADQIYIGGQHLKPPVYNGSIYVVNNVNRTHGYIITVKGLLSLYKWLNETSNWETKSHIDHHYGKGHETKAIKAYAPYEWLVGQSGDKSDICNKDTKERWWTPQKSIQQKISHSENKDIFAAVIGLHRSGSSCIAMILHKLGINMGDNLGGYENNNGGGGEAQRLAQICEQAATFPSTTMKISPELLEKKLGDWIKERISKAKVQNTIAGGKYPHLCAMGNQLMNILGGKLRIIHCDRPLEESIDSLKRRSKKSKGWLNISDDNAEKVQNWLWKNKNEFLNKMDQKYILNLKYKDILEDTDNQISRIVQFLEINPTEQQIQNAIDHVKKQN